LLCETADSRLIPIDLLFEKFPGRVMVVLEAGLLHGAGIRHVLIRDRWVRVIPSVKSSLKTLPTAHKKLAILHRYSLKRFRETEMVIFIFYVENRK
jgi:hypothetical protein